MSEIKNEVFNNPIPQGVGIDILSNEERLRKRLSTQKNTGQVALYVMAYPPYKRSFYMGCWKLLLFILLILFGCLSPKKTAIKYPTKTDIDSLGLSKKYKVNY